MSSGTKGTYWYSPEVERVIKKLVEESALFPDLQGVPITALFTEKKMKVKGRPVLARIKKSSEFEMALIETMQDQSENHVAPPPAYVMIVSHDEWNDLDHVMVDRVGNVDQQEALVFHELCHCEVKISDEGISSYGTKTHDFTGFFAEAVRYGAWLPDYKDTLAAFAGDLPDEAKPEEE